MIKIVRFLLIVMPALAVPFQGALAVSAGQCMALEHHAAAAGDGHDRGDAQSDGGSSGHDYPKSSHCGPCANCCAASAIASSERISLPEAPTTSVAAALPPAFTGIHPAILDRPPLAL